MAVEPGRAGGADLLGKIQMRANVNSDPAATRRLMGGCAVQEIRRDAPKAFLDALDDPAAAQRLESAYMGFDKGLGVVARSHFMACISQVPIDTIEALRSGDRRDRAICRSGPNGARLNLNDRAFRIVGHVACRRQADIMSAAVNASMTR